MGCVSCSDKALALKLDSIHLHGFMENDNGRLRSKKALAKTRLMSDE
jgi:hypothetical protein